MFEDLDDDSGFNPAVVNNTQDSSQHEHQSSGYSQRTQEQGGYNNGQYGGNQGGYNNNRQGGYGNSGGYGGGGSSQQRSGGYGGGGGFQRKEDVLQDAYIPVAFHVEKDFPEEVKSQIFDIASKMLGKKMTVRINADDKAFIDRLMALNNDKVEVYLPWRGFNQIESKRTFNTITCKDIAAKHFIGWEKIPDSVKAIMAAQVRMMFGDRNNSIALCLITWSKDGASKPMEVSKDTGRVSFVIKMAASYGFPVLNLQRPQALAAAEKTFNL